MLKRVLIALIAVMFVGVAPQAALARGVVVVEDSAVAVASVAAAAASAVAASAVVVLEGLE